MLCIGVLLPRSTLFPSLGLDILNGIKACLAHYKINEEFKLLTDNIGFGTDEAEIYTKAEKLLLQDDAAIVIVIAENRIGEMLEPLFTATNKIMMLVNMGANFPDSWNAASTTIVHSLNFCLHTRLSGKLAATAADKHAAYVTSYYDGGYRQCYSFLNSHQQNGGIPCYTHVTHFKEEEFTLAPLDEFLKQRPEVRSLLCLFSGDMAARFYREVIPLQRQYDLSLYVSPMMLDEGLAGLPGDTFAVQNARGYSPWVSFLENEHNHTFTNSYQRSCNKKANLFALLGWDTGLLLKEVLQQFKSGATDSAKILLALGNASFDSPRGWLKLDAGTNHTYGPSWLLSCSNLMELKLVEDNPDIDKEWNDFTNELFPSGESSSWRNTYLCI